MMKNKDILKGRRVSEEIASSTFSFQIFSAINIL